MLGGFKVGSLWSRLTRSMLSQKARHDEGQKLQRAGIFQRNGFSAVLHGFKVLAVAKVIGRPLCPGTKRHRMILSGATPSPNGYLTENAFSANT